MKRLQKRLTLNRDTIRELTAEDMAFVGGGGTGEDEGTICGGCVHVQERNDEESGIDLCRQGGGGGGFTGGGGGGGGGGLTGTINYSNVESEVYIGTICKIEC